MELLGGAQDMKGRIRKNGDQVGGDQISVGDISESQGVAIGRGARVEIRSGRGTKELAQLFSPIYQKIESRPPDSSVEKEEIADRVKRIEKEVATGDKAEPAKVERWLQNLAAMAPWLRTFWMLLWRP
jgi:hypothetical protein